MESRFRACVARAKISPDSADPQKKDLNPSFLRILKNLPENQRGTELYNARKAALSREDQALRRLALLISQWGDTPRRRQFATDMLTWRARHSESQARILLSMAHEIVCGIERRAEARACAERVQAVLGALVAKRSESERLGGKP